MGSALANELSHSGIDLLSGRNIEPKRAILVWESTSKPGAVSKVIMHSIQACGLEPHFIYNSEITTHRTMGSILQLQRIEETLKENSAISIVMLHTSIATISGLTLAEVKDRVIRACGKSITIIWSTLTGITNQDQDIFVIPLGDYRWIRTTRENKPELLCILNAIIKQG